MTEIRIHPWRGFSQEHPPYEETVAVLASRMRELFGPGAYLVEVRHDDWCGIYEKKDCNCEYEIWVDLTEEQIGRIPPTELISLS